MLDLCLRSRSLYPEWVSKLEALTGMDAGYWPCGILAPVLAPDLSDPVSVSGDQGQAWLDPTVIQQRQPGLSSEVVGGWWFPEDAQVDNRALVRVLRAAAQELGVTLVDGISVEAILHHQDRVIGLETAQGDWPADRYILATGAWSGQLLPVPVVPRKGQMLAVRALGDPQQPLRHVLFGDRIYIVPRQDGRIVIGATSEDVGFTPHNTPAGLQRLLQEAIALYPPLQDFPIQEVWWGFRPATPDEFPILGFSPYRNLLLATGHYRNGILLAPVTAALIADLIVREAVDPLLAAFSWQRFHPKQG
jgi:glycine oxidase ThiO